MPVRIDNLVRLLCAGLVLAALILGRDALARQDAAPCGRGPCLSLAEFWHRVHPQAREPAAAVPATRDAARRAVVSPERRRHILDGDRTGGGHRPGTGSPGKSEFPAGWSDNKIIQAIEEVANDPASHRTSARSNRTVLQGVRDGVEIRVIVESDGHSIVTGYPTNAPRNAKPPR